MKPPRDKAGASRRGRALLVRAWLALSLLAAWPAFSTERDCRYVEETVGMDPQASQGVLLPDTDLFRPILADQREPRFYADYRRVHFRSASSAALSEGNGQNVDVTLLNYAIAHGVTRQNLSFEVINLLVSFEDTWWRVFGGGGVVAFSSKDPDVASTPGIIEFGFELRSPHP